MHLEYATTQRINQSLLNPQAVIIINLNYKCTWRTLWTPNILISEVQVARTLHIVPWCTSSPSTASKPIKSIKISSSLSIKAKWHVGCLEIFPNSQTLADPLLAANWHRIRQPLVWTEDHYGTQHASALLIPISIVGIEIILQKADSEP